jgi:hypothetical protein
VVIPSVPASPGLLSKVQVWIDIMKLAFLEEAKAGRQTIMRYYSEWLDGEYELKSRLDPSYSHYREMNRSLRFHALYGSTIVISDAQLIDIRNPLTSLFNDPGFRRFLKMNPNFLALAAQPVAGIKDLNFAISMKGLERLANQANKPDDSFEMAIARLGEQLAKHNHFEPKLYLSRSGSVRGNVEVQRIFRDFPQYKSRLKGLLNAMKFFCDSPGECTTVALNSAATSYDDLLKKASERLPMSSDQHERIQLILRTQNDKVNPEQHGRRAAIRKVLALGRWHQEQWENEHLRCYLDVVHSWNCAISESIAPDAATLYESYDDIPLSRMDRVATDEICWEIDRLIDDSVPDTIRTLWRWDIDNTSWEQLAGLAAATRNTAVQLQNSLSQGTLEQRQEAFNEHALTIAATLIGFPTLPKLKQWHWDLISGVAKITKTVPSDLVNVAKIAYRFSPGVYISFNRKRVVNTLSRGKSLIGLTRY